MIPAHRAAALIAPTPRDWHHSPAAVRERRLTMIRKREDLLYRKCANNIPPPMGRWRKVLHLVAEKILYAIGVLSMIALLLGTAYLTGWAVGHRAGVIDTLSAPIIKAGRAIKK